MRDDTLKINFNDCCSLLFEHKAPEECSTESKADRDARLRAMQENLQSFLRRIGDWVPKPHEPHCKECGRCKNCGKHNCHESHLWKAATI